MMQSLRKIGLYDHSGIRQIPVKDSGVGWARKSSGTVKAPERAFLVPRCEQLIESVFRIDV